MYPHEFDYYRAESIAEALELFERNSTQEVELIAGGHSLLPMMKSGLADPDVVVDISGIEDLRGVADRGNTLSIGAATTYSEVVGSQTVKERFPAFAAAVAAIGDVQVRNVGTIGGNLVRADPASDLPGPAVASDVTFVIAGSSGERTIDADGFFLGRNATDVGPDEILTRAEFPIDDTVSAYERKPNPSSGIMVGVAVALDIEGTTVRSARVGANGATVPGKRLHPVEDALEGALLSDATAAVGGVAGALEEIPMVNDVHASAEFRSHLLQVYAKRAVASAVENAHGAPADRR